jgi:hypothetical protein
MYQFVSFQEPDFAEKCIELFERDGFCVIQDVFLETECKNWIEAIFTFFESLGTGIDRTNVKETWLSENLPQTRTGLFQAIVGNMQSVWDIRSHPNIQKIFQMIYSHLHQKEITDFIVSNDGINFCPNGVGRSDGKDWAHVDQTIRDMVCVQGQAVLSNTSACFRASPGSHKIYNEILDFEKVPKEDVSNWHKIEKTQDVRKMVESIGGQYQIPILAPSGSFIIWSSKTIHSARLAIRVEEPSMEDIWLGLRAVVYVCYRPRDEFSKEEIARRANVVAENRTTNHAGVKIFAKKPGNFRVKYHPKIEELIKNPRLVYRFSPLKLDATQKRLAGILA